MRIRVHCTSKGKWSEGKGTVLFVGLVCALMLAATGCASLGQDYNARYGLTNPDNSPTRTTLSDETFSAGTVGQKYMEDYDKKYHEEDGISSSVPPAPIVEENE